MKVKELERMLSRNGFVLVRNNKHSVYFNSETNTTVIVPRHKEVNKFIANKIVRELKVA